jgi:hypothetical protein
MRRPPTVRTTCIGPPGGLDMYTSYVARLSRPVAMVPSRLHALPCTVTSLLKTRKCPGALRPGGPRTVTGRLRRPPLKAVPSGFPSYGSAHGLGPGVARAITERESGAGGFALTPAGAAPGQRAARSRRPDLAGDEGHPLTLTPE